MLPEEVAADGAPKGGRYDHVIRLFGAKFVEEKIMNARTFMVRTRIRRFFMVWYVVEFSFVSRGDVNGRSLVFSTAVK